MQQQVDLIYTSRKQKTHAHTKHLIYLQHYTWILANRRCDDNRIDHEIDSLYPIQAISDCHYDMRMEKKRHKIKMIKSWNLNKSIFFPPQLCGHKSQNVGVLRDYLRVKLKINWKIFFKKTHSFWNDRTKRNLSQRKTEKTTHLMMMIIVDAWSRDIVCENNETIAWNCLILWLFEINFVQC